MTDKIPREKQNGFLSEPPAPYEEGRTSVEASTVAASAPNGHARPAAAGVLVVCPEMCCFCFDVLIAHLTNTHHGTRSPFLKCFKNDE